jgi:deoxyribodipyrimidine photolyase-related protein
MDHEVANYVYTMTTNENITIVYPNQLFRISQTDAIEKGRTIILVEEPLFFTRLKFHKQKILLHRASMNAYKDYLESHGYTVKYLESIDFDNTKDVLTHIAEKLQPQSVNTVRPSDYLLKKSLLEWESNLSLTINWYESPLFVTKRQTLAEFFAGKDSVRMSEFYKSQRRRMDILVTDDGQPVGGQWSFDEDNREPLPKDKTFPSTPDKNRSQYVEEAEGYVEKNFSDHYGQTDGFFYPVTRRQALDWLDDFFNYRFANFGPYEDAFSKDSNSYLWHSVLTPFMNIGLVTPAEVIEKALVSADKNDIPINSLEGFVRQIIGWREFMHGLYIFHGSRVRTKNFFNHDRGIPESFWTADTDNPPVDRVIQKVHDTGYAHHIERLMVLANYMTLTEFHPHDVYGWFMEMFVDAYDWVMVPNVYSMGIFADGGVMATKPYVASSNYVTKMSDWKRDKDNHDHWSYRWDALYWRFLHKHREFFDNNARLSRVTSHLDRMGEGKLSDYLNQAQTDLSKMSQQSARFSETQRSELFASGSL